MRLFDAAEAFSARLLKEKVNMHGFMLSAGGRIAVRGVYTPFRHDRPHRLYSVSKTMTGIAVGILLEENLLSLDNRIVRFFEDWLPENPSPFLLRLTIRDMLRMATCFRHTAYREGVDENWARAFFTTTPDHEPGTVFSYDTGNSQVLAALVRRLSGMEVFDFLEQRLFIPLGLRDERRWLRDPSGCCQGGTGLCMSLRDFHRVSECLLNGGEGLIPAGYLEQMTRRQIATSLQDKPEEKYGYGWQCWITRAGWSMYGMGGQLAVFCPEKNAVLTTIADTRLDPFGVQRIYDAFYEELEPFLTESPVSVPLTLEFPSPRLKADSEISPAADQTYLFEEGNDLDLSSLRLEKRQLVFSRSGQSAVIPLTAGETLSAPFPGHPETPALLRSAWQEPGLLRVRCDAVGDAPCGFDMLVRFKENSVTVQSRCSSDPLTRGYDGIASGFVKESSAQAKGLFPANIDER